MEGQEVLTPYSTTSGPSSMTILILGEQGTHKHDLARSIVALHPEIQVRTATNLPLPEKNAHLRPRIDYIVLVVDLANRKSFTRILEIIGNIDVKYFLGKVCFLATSADSTNEQSIDVMSVSKYANSCRSPLFTADLKDEQSRDVVSAQILRMAGISAGTNPEMSSFLLSSSDTAFAVSTL